MRATVAGAGALGTVCCVLLAVRARRVGREADGGGPKGETGLAPI
ncbi:hypothetical protein ABZ920_26200 [Streptomyces sp. NPDC046831]